MSAAAPSCGECGKPTIRVHGPGRLSPARKRATAGGEGRRGGRVSTVVQAYRFALDPTPAQEAALRSHCCAQRKAYNWGLSRVKANLGQREAERS